MQSRRKPLTLHLLTQILLHGRQFVAGQDPMQTQAAALATQGVGSYSPYLQAAQTAQTTGAGALGQSLIVVTAVGGLGADIQNQAYGGLGAFQTAGGNIAQGAGYDGTTMLINLLCLRINNKLLMQRLIRV